MTTKMYKTVTTVKAAPMTKRKFAERMVGKPCPDVENDDGYIVWKGGGRPDWIEKNEFDNIYIPVK